MTVKRITTRSGSEYRYDEDARTVTWTSPSGEPRSYTAITDVVLMVGYPFVYAGTRDRCGRPMSRRTTPVVSVEDEPTLNVWAVCFVCRRTVPLEDAHDAGFNEAGEQLLACREHCPVCKDGDQ